MITKGYIITLSGVVAFIGTVIWIFMDIKNKAKREKKLLDKVITNTHKNIEINDENYGYLNKYDGTVKSTGDDKLYINHNTYDAQTESIDNEETEFLYKEETEFIDNEETELLYK